MFQKNDNQINITKNRGYIVLKSIFSDLSEFGKIIGFDIEKLNERTDDESMKLNN